MLRFLSIRRLAVIDSAEVEFEPGLNVLTGETGAGKSILVEAVGLLLGGRASGDLVRTGEETAAIEAIFESGGEELLVRREITAQGRSRAFINGALVTATALKELSGRLIELHGQHEHQTLLDPTTHLAVLDAFGGLASVAAPVALAFERMREAKDALDRQRRLAADRGARQELVAFQLAELDRVAPKAAEDEELAARRQVLASAERVERLCEESYASLYESDGAILAGLGGVWRRVGELAALDSAISAVPRRARRDQRSARRSGAVPAALRRRHRGVAGTAAADGGAARAARAVEAEVRARAGRRDRAARCAAAGVPGSRALGRARRRAVAGVRRQRDPHISRQPTRCPGPVDGWPSTFPASWSRCSASSRWQSTRFEVRFNAEALPESAWSAQGVDAAEFFVSPNPGEELRPLARIVSGGELSRIMLAIKTLTATTRHGFTDAADRPPSTSAPGLIFDEVDAGIGGRVADVVGRKLRRPGLGVSGALHHASPADCDQRRHALPDRKTGGGRPDEDDGEAPDRRRAGGRDRANARRRS